MVGSIGPYGAHLHDGSEYTGNYADSTGKEVIKKWHRPRLDAVIAAGVNALAIETIPCLVSSKWQEDNPSDNKYSVSFKALKYGVENHKMC